MDEAGTQRRAPTYLTVFLAEDDSELRNMMAQALRRDGHVVIEASDGATLLLNVARSRMRQERSDDEILVVSDIRMPGFDGLSVLRHLRDREGPCPQFLFMTAFGDQETHEEARRLGAILVLDKPFDLDELRALVRDVATRRAAVAGAKSGARDTGAST